MDAILLQINKDRCGEVSDLNLVKHVVSSLITLGIDQRNPTWFYKLVLEPSLLEDVQRFYKIESDRFLQENDLPSFLRKIEKRIEEEQKRICTYFHPSTEKMLIRDFYKVCIEGRMDFILSEVNYWLDVDKKEGLFY